MGCMWGGAGWCEVVLGGVVTLGTLWCEVVKWGDRRGEVMTWGAR